MLNLNELIGFGAGGADTTFKVNFAGSMSFSTANSTHTFNNVPIGEETANRIVVLRVAAGFGITSLTVNGVAATLIANTGGFMYMAIGVVGSTATITMVLPGSSQASMFVHVVHNPVSTTPVIAAYVTGNTASITATLTGSAIGDAVVGAIHGVTTMPTISGTAGVTEYDSFAQGITQYKTFNGLSAAANGTVIANNGSTTVKYLSAVAWR